MDEERTKLVVAGVYLGDITLALAGMAPELPPYVRGLDPGEFLAEDAGVEETAKQVEEQLKDLQKGADLPEALVRSILDRAIVRGKFLSAGRCLEILGERASYVEEYLSRARSHLAEDQFKEAAEALVVAANLDLGIGVPLFQYSGPDLHFDCAVSPGQCLTRISIDRGLTRALEYLLPSPRVNDVIVRLSTKQRKGLLPHVASQRDPNAAAFVANHQQAQEALVQMEKETMGDVPDQIERIKTNLERLHQPLVEVYRKASRRGREETEAKERLIRPVTRLLGSFKKGKELAELWQFRRLRRDLEELEEAREDIMQAGQLVEGDRGAEAAVQALNGLIEGLGQKKTLERITSAEEQLDEIPRMMLGRRVHSQEYWQYFRELAFKYPVSPLMCCVRRMNDRLTVVPVWDSELVGILRDHFAGHQQPSSS